MDDLKQIPLNELEAKWKAARADCMAKGVRATREDQERLFALRREIDRRKKTDGKETKLIDFENYLTD